MKEYTKDTVKLIQADCMEIMKTLPDNFYDLSIVDPPYGIGIDGQKESKKNGVQIRKQHDFKNWDNAIPSKEYFNELQRISKNQIIWGGNYFTEYLKPTKAWIFWYKGQQGLTMSDGELAWTSVKQVTRMVNIHRTHIWQENPKHPTQKPVDLYKWLLRKYAKPGDKIIDTHGGSFSSAVAAWQLGFDYLGIEIDEEYFDNAVKRLSETDQTELFAMDM